jgi:TolB protein
MRILTVLATASLFAFAACKNTSNNKNHTDSNNTDSTVVGMQTEKHLKNMRQLTHGGNNAEAYFSFDGSMLTFQSDNKNWGVECDQIFYMKIEDAARDTGFRAKMISTGKGRTTCSYFMGGDSLVVYASTHLKHEKCPPPAPHDPKKYLWAI